MGWNGKGLNAMGQGREIWRSMGYRGMGWNRVGCPVISCRGQSTCAEWGGKEGNGMVWDGTGQNDMGQDGKEVTVSGGVGKNETGLNGMK